MPKPIPLAVSLFAITSAAEAQEYPEIFDMIEACTDHSLEADEVSRHLLANGWEVVPPSEFEVAAEFLGDAFVLYGASGYEPATMADERARRYRGALARIKRKDSIYFSSPTLWSANRSTVLNIFLHKQFNEFECLAAATDRSNLISLSRAITAMTNTGSMLDIGPSWHILAAVGKGHDLLVRRSVLKQETIDLFFDDPLTATVGISARYLRPGDAP